MSALSDAIDKLYLAFRAPRPERIEGCPHCVEPGEFDDLLRTNLREIGPDQLAPYASSVLLTVGETRDFRYFLPRILDISIAEADWWPAREVVLRRLADAGYLEWPAHEKAALREVLYAWLEDVASSNPVDSDAIDSLVCGLSLAGEPVEELLAFLLKHPPALAAFHEENENSIVHNGRLSNVFWNQNDGAIGKVVAFLESEPATSTLVEYWDRLRPVSSG